MLQMICRNQVKNKLLKAKKYLLKNKIKKLKKKNLKQILLKK